LHISVSPSLIRRAAVAVGVVALGVATFAPTGAFAHIDKKHATINTYKVWDGSTTIQAFGCPDTTTYGQVITVPAGKTTLNKYTFYMNDFGATGSMVVRGEVYAWNGTMATGSSLSETAARTLDYSDALFHKETFKAGGITVTPGSQYVVFASIDKDFESCTGSYTNGWGGVSDSVYSGGTFVYQNNTGDESQWTATPWNTFGFDLAFKAFLS
jgi:hypothetical protein